MADPAASVAVYDQLKIRLQTGYYRPGSCLRGAEIAEELGVSVTPAREALIRLAAEGLAEEIQRRGFFTVKLTEADLRDLYELNLGFVTLAIGRAAGSDLSACLPFDERLAYLRNCREKTRLANELAQEAQDFFRHVVATSRNQGMIFFHRNVQERLHLARCVENSILSNAAEDMEKLWSLSKDGNRKDLRRAIYRYHQKRMNIVGSIISKIDRCWEKISADAKNGIAFSQDIALSV